VIIRPEAERDIVDAVDWYEDQQSGLGNRFRRSLDQVLGQIELMPEMHRVVHKDVRRALTKPFPFAVYYRVWEGEVIVWAVLHSRRDSDHWKTRL
jgi:plasmid stabilization system protein ParE